MSCASLLANWIPARLDCRPGVTYYSAFMPTTPNPTSGFLFFVEKKEVTILDLTVEEAAKLVISAGLVTPTQMREAKRVDRGG